MASLEEHEFMCDTCLETKALREEVAELKKSLDTANWGCETRIKNAIAGKDYRIKELEAAVLECKDFILEMGKRYTEMHEKTTYGKLVSG